MHTCVMTIMVSMLHTVHEWTIKSIAGGGRSKEVALPPLPSDTTHTPIRLYPSLNVVYL